MALIFIVPTLQRGNDKKLDLLKLSDQKCNEYEHFINNRLAEESLIWNSKIEGKIEVACNLKIAAVPIDIIMKSTGLIREEIEKLV